MGRNRRTGGRASPTVKREKKPTDSLD